MDLGFFNPIRPKKQNNYVVFVLCIHTCFGCFNYIKRFAAIYGSVEQYLYLKDPYSHIVLSPKVLHDDFKSTNQMKCLSSV